MSNYACNCRTCNYTSSENKYAKLFTVNTTKFNIPSYSNSKMLFVLYHGQTTLIEKKYYVYVNDNTIKFKDLTPDIDGIECVYTLNDTTLTFYVKGSEAGSDIKLKVEQANSIGFIDFFPFEKFVTELESVIYPTYDTPIYLTTATTKITSLLNGWEIERDCIIKQTLNVVNINIVARGGTVSSGITIYKLSEDIKPKNDCTFIGLGRLSNDTFYPVSCRVFAATGNIQVTGLQGNTQLVLQFSYIR